MKRKTAPGSGTPGAPTGRAKILRGEHLSIAERLVGIGVIAGGFGYLPEHLRATLDLASYPYRLSFRDGSTLLVERFALMLSEIPLDSTKAN
jgi:hypothetical protein